MNHVLKQIFFLVLITIFTSGCASLQAPDYSPNYKIIDNLKNKDIQRMSVGEIQPKDKNASINYISLRGRKLISPCGGTFANYLENAIRSDFIEMGIYDPTSTTELNATILKNDIDISGISSGYGVMEVELTLKKKGNMVFKKIYSANIEFESAFSGNIAIPTGQAAYPDLVRKLLQTIYTDKQFLEMVQKND